MATNIHLLFSIFKTLGVLNDDTLTTATKEFFEAIDLSEIWDDEATGLDGCINSDEEPIAGPVNKSFIAKLRNLLGKDPLKGEKEEEEEESFTARRNRLIEDANKRLDKHIPLVKVAQMRMLDLTNAMVTAYCLFDESHPLRKHVTMKLVFYDNNDISIHEFKAILANLKEFVVKCKEEKIVYSEVIDKFIHICELVAESE